jgi:hypothetical protein
MVGKQSTINQEGVGNVLAIMPLIQLITVSKYC